MIRREFLKTTILGTLVTSAHQWLPADSPSHIISFSFDDGFKKSFLRAAEIHEEYGTKACLNVIATGHMPDFKAIDQWILPELMGSFHDWNDLVSRGHEVMPHTWAHLNLTKVPIDLAKTNIEKCLDYFEKNLDGYKAEDAVYNFAFNASTLELDQFVLERIRAVRTGGWLVFDNTKVNTVPAKKAPARLGCIFHGPDLGDHFLEAEVNEFLASEGGWMIFNLHGLDGEGWGPVSTQYYDGLIKRLAKNDQVTMLPVGEVLKKFG